MRPISTCIAGALAAAASPAAAEVVTSSEGGFVSHNEALVVAGPAKVWSAMLEPASWWNGEHTYSGDPANLSLDPTAGGCFCEVVPDAGGGAAGQIEHMRVVYLAPGTTLRMAGALGPLQSEAVTGVLTMTVESAGSGTKITWDYVVGGYMRMPMVGMAPLVDRVVGEQLTRLAARLANP